MTDFVWLSNESVVSVEMGWKTVHVNSGQLENEDKQDSVGTQQVGSVLRKGLGQAGFMLVAAEAGHCASYDRISQPIDVSSYYENQCECGE